MTHRRSFLNSLLRTAAIVALAPQLCFGKPVAKIKAPEPALRFISAVWKYGPGMKPLGRCKVSCPADDPVAVADCKSFIHTAAYEPHVVSRIIMESYEPES